MSEEARINAAVGRHDHHGARLKRAAEGDADGRFPRQRLARPSNPFTAAFLQGLRETGYVDGQNLTIEYRWAASRYDRLPALAADLVARKIDVIAASGGLEAAVAAKNATSTSPLVFFAVSDPVGNRLIAILARPGGNVPGVSPLSIELMPKRLEGAARIQMPEGCEIVAGLRVWSRQHRVLGCPPGQQGAL